MNVSLPLNLLAGGAPAPADAAPADPLLDLNAAQPSGGDFASALLASLTDGQDAAPAMDSDSDLPAGDEAKAGTPAPQPGALAAQPLPLMPAMPQPVALAPQAAASAQPGVEAAARAVTAAPRQNVEAELPADALSAALNTLTPLPAKPTAAGEAQAGREPPTPALPAAPALAAIAPQQTDKAGAPLPEWAPIKLPAQQPASWGDKLSAALGERLQVQSSHGMDRALIRLDPPSLGSLEISIRHEAGALQVQLTASHGEVVRQLQAIGDSLRQDLSNRQYTQVAVEVREGAPGQGGQQRQERQGQQQPQRAPGRALAEAGQGDGQGFWLGQG
ncbi:flagellar hook-length control protein FliK [Chromobacterium sp.]|uniref:flagellar hook-length control protein FliK n=1 Tax=Chromobacterium sp. TaxID=306190 RepID=UPI0035AFB287